MRKITFKDILDYLDSRGAFKFMPDELYLKFMFRLGCNDIPNSVDGSI